MTTAEETAGAYCTARFAREDGDGDWTSERVFCAHLGALPPRVVEARRAEAWHSPPVLSLAPRELVQHDHSLYLCDGELVFAPWAGLPEVGARAFVALTEERALEIAEAALAADGVREGLGRAARDARSLARALLRTRLPDLVVVDEAVRARIFEERSRRRGGNELWESVVRVYDEAVRAYHRGTSREAEGRLRDIARLTRLLVERERLAYEDLSRADLQTLVILRRLRGWHFQSPKWVLVRLLREADPSFGGGVDAPPERREEGGAREGGVSV